MLEGAVPKDQTASKKSEGKASQPEDSLVVEQGQANTNLGPREAFEKAISGGLVHFLCMTVVGLAFNQSPASLRGLVGISRATRAKKSQSMKVGVMLMGKLEVATESQTVLPSSNPPDSKHHRLFSCAKLECERAKLSTETLSLARQDTTFAHFSLLPISEETLSIRKLLHAHHFDLSDYRPPPGLAEESPHVHIFTDGSCSITMTNYSLLQVQHIRRILR